MIYPKLYKRDNTGGIRVWFAEAYKEPTRTRADKDTHVAKYRFHSGRQDGKFTISDWTIVEPKNVGRSNETEPFDQAVKEINAMYAKKRKRGYFNDLKDIDTCELIKPMLAHKFEDHKNKLEYPVYVQPKLDGIRCLATPEGLFTRKGERISSCPHIEDAIMPFVKKFNIIFDGELYNHDLKDDFNKIQSLVTRKHIDEKQEIKIEKYVQYHIYDIIDAGNFKERITKLNTIKAGMKLSGPLRIVPTERVSEPEYLDDMYDLFLEDGYEGQMVRANKAYQNKRSNHLLKRKEFQDAEFKILSIHEGKGNRSGMAGYAVLELRKNKTFSAAFMGTNDYRKKLLKDAKFYVGDMATVKFFRFTPDGVPRFPVIKAIRVKGY